MMDQRVEEYVRDVGVNIAEVNRPVRQYLLRLHVFREQLDLNRRESREADRVDSIRNLWEFEN